MSLLLRNQALNKLTPVCSLMSNGFESSNSAVGVADSFRIMASITERVASG